MCRNLNCEACSSFEEHHCRKCNRSNVAHRSANCRKSYVRGGGRVLCRVKGCDICDVGERHFCGICGDSDSTHFSRDCPNFPLPQSRVVVAQPVILQGGAFQSGVVILPGYGYGCVVIRR